MTTATSSSKRSAPKPIEMAGWRRLTLHTITLPSGARVQVRFPNLALLIKEDAIPEHLRQVALRESLRDDGDPPLALQTGADGEAIVDVETVKALYQLYEYLVVAMVVSPAITAEDLPDLPQLDLDLLTMLATRQTNMDASGAVIGVEPLQRYTVWREEHGCGDDCVHCNAVVARFSTLQPEGAAEGQ